MFDWYTVLCINNSRDKLMSLNHNEIEIQTIEQQELNANAEGLRKRLASMKGVASQKSIALSILKLIPFFNKFIASANGAGNAITRMIEIEGLVNNATQTATSVFQYIKLGTAIIDFFRIPAIYVGALIAKQEVPFTFSRNAKLLYSAVILGLTITAIAFPPAAPIIALVAGVAALGQSIVTLTNLYYKRIETQDKLVQVEKDIAQKTERVNFLIDELEKLEKTAGAAKDDDIKSLKRDIAQHLNELQGLYDTREYCKQKLEKLGTAAALDKTVGVGLAAFALVGIVTSMIFPPVGVGILAATASLGVAYLVARVTVPLIKFLAEKIIDAVTKKPHLDNEQQNDQELKNGLMEKNTLAYSDIPSMFDNPGLKNEGKALAKKLKDLSGTCSQEHFDLTHKITPKSIQSLIANPITVKSDYNMVDQKLIEDSKHLIP